MFLGGYGAFFLSSRDEMHMLAEHLLGRKMLQEKNLSQTTASAKTSDGTEVYDAWYLPAGVEPHNLPDHVTKSGCGLGFNVMTTHGVPVIWHSGGRPGYYAIRAYFPPSDTKLALLANTDNGLIPQYENIMKVCTAIVYPEKAP